MTRLTYKSCMGDYGSNVDYNNSFTEIQALRNALGKYEDIGLSPEEISKIVDDSKYTSGNILPEADKDIEFVIVYFDKVSLEKDGILKVKGIEHHIGFYSSAIKKYVSMHGEDFLVDDVYNWRYVRNTINVGDVFNVHTN